MSESLLKLKRLQAQRQNLSTSTSKLFSSPNVGGGGKGFPVEPSFGRVLALVNDKEAVCGGNVNGGKVCLKPANASCNHKVKGAYVKEDTLYVRAAKGAQLTTVFGAYHLLTSNLETDLVNYLVKLEEGEINGDAVTLFSFIENNEINTVDDFKEAKERQKDMSKQPFKTPAVKRRNLDSQEDLKQETVEVLGALTGLMKELVDNLGAETQAELESEGTLGGGTLLECTDAMAEVITWKINDEGPIRPLLDIASRVDELTTSHLPWEKLWTTWCHL